MVELELSLKRVQSFIFEVPRLKAMLGANALIGQVMRHELPALLGEEGQLLDWPAEISGNYPAQGHFSDDPLNDTADPDNPADLYRRGILARDGGHFIVAFPNEISARNFLRRAAQRFAKKLPGVAYEAKIDKVEIGPNATEHHLLNLPMLQVCQETGQAPASNKGAKGKWQARSVSHRLKWGEKFRNQTSDPGTQDIVGLMRDQLYPTRSGDVPRDIADLVGGGYLALIHADGNGIGKRYKQWGEKAPTEHGTALEARVAQEAHGEAFFHSMRVAVRCAVVEAIGQTFGPNHGTRPYEILMLGGDDLLLACRADLALDYALNYANALQRHVLADGEALDVAIGVAIAGESYPLHRLHDLAESLTSSAKRLYRACDESRGSVIDWQVVTQSWFADVAETRRKSEIVSYQVGDEIERLLLSGRPYFVSGDDGLEALIKAKKTLEPQENGADQGRAPRSALRNLRGACEQGRLAGETAFAALDERSRSALGWWTGDGLWKPRESADAALFLTRALDVIDIWEIARLGNRRDD